MAPNSPAEASADFKLSITRALADQLADALSRLNAAPLTSEQLSALQQRPGVYELFVRGRRVYVGKASVSVPARLGNHLRKLSGRRDIVLSDMSFQCLYVDEDLDAAAPEKMLIKKYRDQRDQDGAPWNTNGFGNKDPGRNRDHSLVKANHFDAEHPINLGVRIESVAPGSYPARTYLRTVKAWPPLQPALRHQISARQTGLQQLDGPRRARRADGAGPHPPRDRRPARRLAGNRASRVRDLVPRGRGLRQRPRALAQARRRGQRNHRRRAARRPGGNR